MQSGILVKKIHPLAPAAQVLPPSGAAPHGLAVPYQSNHSPSLSCRCAASARSTERLCGDRREMLFGRCCAFARRQLVRKGDVIMAVDSDKIASDGSVRLVPTAVPMGQQRRMMSCAQVVFRKGERISFHFKISQKFVGDKVLRRRRSACGAWLCVGTLAAADNSCALHAACCCHCLSPRQVMLDVMRDGKTMKIELALTTCALLHKGMRPAVPSTDRGSHTYSAQATDSAGLSLVPMREGRRLSIRASIGTVCAVCGRC